eukprot:SAG11_NODE_3025_length_2754_cov_2.335593_2_plen_96_part_00
MHMQPTGLECGGARCVGFQAADGAIAFRRPALQLFNAPHAVRYSTTAATATTTARLTCAIQLWKGRSDECLNCPNAWPSIDTLAIQMHLRHLCWV